VLLLQVRLSNSATDVMLERAFTLNFNFFDNTNGAGTRHLLKLAKMEHARRTGASRDSSTHRCVASVLLMCC
jgi:hypothetical protein